MRVAELRCDEETEFHVWARHRVTLREVEEAAYRHGFAIRGRTKGVYEVYGRRSVGDTPDIRLIESMAKSRKKDAPSDKALRAYYEKSSRLQENADIRPVKMSFPRPRRLVALRLEHETLEGVKRLAVQKGLNYSTLMRMWITERLRREKE